MRTLEANLGFGVGDSVGGGIGSTVGYAFGPIVGTKDLSGRIGRRGFVVWHYRVVEGLVVKGRLRQLGNALQHIVGLVVMVSQV